MLNIGLIGCGMMGKVHTNAYKNLKDVDFNVKYVSDFIKEKSDFCEKELNTSTATFEEIINDEEIDVIDLCTPTYTHKNLAIKAAKKGKNIFCEKPIALNEKDAQEIIDVCKENNVKLMIGHVVRFFPEYKKAKMLIENNEIGKATIARFYRGGVYPSHGIDNWFNDLEKSGGVFVDLSIHDFDFLRTIFGEIESIEARSAKISYGNIKNFDHGTAILKFKNGKIAHVEGSWAEPENMPINFKTDYEIFGDDGMLNYDSEKSLTFRIQKNKQYTRMNPSNINPYMEEIKAFLLSIINNEEPPVSGEEALKSLKVALAANKSAKEKRTVCFEEMN
ncbi:Gfo/Idh/MocA family oxidoreductase [Oceanotoga sp. DSM 15011]|uniref:Gfo/Idh/MocA family protein n=1 Tax=Oceanotoga sp. DSM 15011 TaxID=2984951 RepID=UPI0021F4471D|nr:Gfo/Idh/MocA family oxidoreductase [Oceanotoga sp. DSM 15011]UYO99464.1 Gfo/Idh/MocA family oxidoreductase [Oceanotoga sp. DSM 15011]